MKKMLLLVALCAANIAAGQSPVPDGARVELIANGFQFVEGPVWKDVTGLLFSDIPANTVYLWTATAGSAPFLKPSSNANGLTLDADGRLVLAQTGSRRVTRLEVNGTQTALAVLYQGKKLNSPNDLVVKSDGAIFFTDPPFNIPAGQSAELSFSGIFRISTSGSLQLLDSSLSRPNGICFSPDEKLLYVNNSIERVIFVWDVVDDSLLANKREFARMAPVGYADGMKVDPQGNIFCTGPLGVWVFAPNGTVLDTIHVPGQTTNCNWGDADRKSLYIISGNSVYRIRLSATGMVEHGSLPADSYELCANYPNPFNPVTTVRFTIHDAQDVCLRVFDLLGREVATIVNEQKDAGTYAVAWNAERVTSGTLFNRLEAGSFVDTKRMLLLR